MSLCIIGAGTAGLCFARHALQNNIKVTIFEQSNEIGGTWVYDSEIGINKYGIEVHSSMYSGLRTNLPKEIMCFPDMQINHSDSYVPSQGICNYLDEYAQHYKLKEHIRFLHHVIRVSPRRNGWQVITKNLENERIVVEQFDFVVVCSGHYHTPLYPDQLYAKSFKGLQLHSHDFRNSKQFQEKSVLIIGAGPSGVDLCHKISKHASRVIISHHLPELTTSFRNNVVQRPDVKKFDANGATFMDGSYEEFSTIFYCTGYKYAFPFLSADCGIFVEDNHVQPLYKHCLNIEYSTMAFIGLPYYVCAAQMIDLQSRFIMEYFTGRKSLPSIKEMYVDTAKEMSTRWKKGYKKRQAHMMGPEQISYYTDLAETAGIENIKPVMTKLHNESSDRFLEDIANFRKDIFKIIDDNFFIKYN